MTVTREEVWEAQAEVNRLYEALKIALEKRDRLVAARYPKGSRTIVIREEPDCAISDLRAEEQNLSRASDHSN